MSAPLRPPNRPGALTWTEPKAIDADNAAEACVSILVQGSSGAGKTHFACSMPQPIIMGVSEPNISVPVGRIQEGHAIVLYPLKDWKDYEWFVRKTKNREWDARTVVLDSYTLIGDFSVQSEMDKPGSLTKDGNLIQARWSAVKGNQFTELLDLLSSSQPEAGRPAYHIVVTVHEQDEAVVDAEGKVTGISAVNPAVPGGLRRSFGAKFDCVFVASQTPRYAKDEKGIQRPVGVDHVLWTIPPDRLRSVKDGLGGLGGRKVLPPTVGNTWAELCNAWGVPAHLKSK